MPTLLEKLDQSSLGENCNKKKLLLIKECEKMSNIVFKNLSVKRLMGLNELDQEEKANLDCSINALNK